MADPHELLLFIATQSGIVTYRWGMIPPEHTVGGLLGVTLGMLAHEKEIGNTDPSGYVVADWSLQPMAADARVAGIPPPRILIATDTSLGDTEARQAFVKFTARPGSDSAICALVEEFQSVPTSQNGTANAYDVFISYSAKDVDIAEELRKSLVAKGVTCFMAAKSIGVASIWEEDIRQALCGSGAVLLLLTPHSISSSWVMSEAGAAWVLQKPLIPALQYLEIHDLPTLITRHQARSISTNKDRSNLCTEIARMRRPRA